MLQVTDKPLENLMFLRDVVAPYMKENADLVNLNVYESTCGTYRCFVGWYGFLRHGLSELHLDRWCEDDSMREREFGKEYFAELFDSRMKSGSLDDRLRRLDGIIAARIAAL